MLKITHLANILIPTSYFTALYTCDMWREPEKVLQTCDIIDSKRFVSVSIPIYFILAQFTRNRIRVSHTICFGYLKIYPLNFLKQLDCNEGGFFNLPHFLSNCKLR